MNAHQLGAGGVILNTIVVDSLNVFPNLIDASVGGTAGDTWNGTAIVKKPIPPRDVAAEKAAFILQIDTDADALIRTVIGERGSQYESAEKQSAAYKAAGYTGTVPPKVQAWATAKNQTATWAADSQIAKAAAWRNAEDALYAKRLLLKETARAAVDGAALDGVKASWVAFMASLKAGLGV